MQAHPLEYQGLFRCHIGSDGQRLLLRAHPAPSVIPCPTSGRPLRVSTIEAGSPAICPACSHQGNGGFVSFEGDLRMAYACPGCEQLVWLVGS